MNLWKKATVVALSLTLLTACGTQKESTVKEKKGKTNTEELVYGLWSSPTGIFNPTISNTMYDNAVNDLVYASLLEMDREYNLVPAMAQKYELSDDMLELTFTLKKDLTFHDGTKLTSDDIAYTLTSVADKEYAGSEYATVEMIKGAKDYHEGKADKIEGIVAKDEQTISISFEKPFASALQKIGTLGILPEHIWEKVPVGEWEQATKELNNPIGSGPYKVVEFKNGEFVKMEAFSDYYQGEPKIKDFNFKVVNQDTALGEIAKGEIDVADISSFKEKDLTFLEKNDISVVSYPGPNIQYMGMNLRNDVLKNKDVRQAIAYGLDRKSIVDELLEGHGQLIQTPMVPTLWSYPTEGLIEYKKDNKKAKELLKKAGYEKENKDGFLEKDGQPLVFTLTVPTGDKTRENTAPIIQNQLKEIGIDIKIDTKEFSSVMDQVVGNHEFDLYLMANTLSADPDPKPSWHSTAASDEEGVYAWNISSLKDKKADELMEKGLETTDQDERATIYHDFGKILNEELPWVPLYTPDIMKAYSPNLKNYEPTTFLDFYHVHEWSFK